MPKFFIQQEDVQGDFLIIREDAHHILHVLRKTPGDHLTVCDGQGHDYECEIMPDKLPDGELRCHIISRNTSPAEPAIHITLLQGLPKAEKMEYLLQKGVEVGVSRFVPLMTERSIVKLTADKARDKVRRWEKIAQSAAKQSGRGILPSVENIQTLTEAVSEFSSYDLVILLDEAEEAITLKHILKKTDNPKKIALLIGPEGGWERREVEQIKAAGGISITLGPRILRTETAGVIAAAMTLYEIDMAE